MFNKLNALVKKHAYQTRTFRELSSLSERELRDIGINRHDIKAIARETANSILF